MGMSMGAIGLGASSASLGMKVGGSFAAAGMQKQDLRTQAFMDDLNAKMSERSAQDAMRAGEEGAGAALRTGTRVKSAQVASMAANGIDVAGSTTAQAVEAGTDVMSQQDANILKANAVRSAWGYRAQETNYQSAARSKRAGADAISGGFNAFTSLLGGAGDVATKWYDYSKDSPG